MSKRVLILGKDPLGKAKYANVTESGDLRVQLSGTIDELRGLLADRPAPDAEGIVPGKTLYWAVDEGWVYATDGTVWHRVVEVGAWT